MLVLPGLNIGKRYDTAVEIDKNYVKIVECESSKTGIVITRLLTEPIAGFSEPDIVKAITNLIRDNNINVERPIAVISRDRTMVRYMRLPATDSAELEDMVSFELTKQMPYSPDEVISDYKIIGTDDEGYSEIMLVILHKAESERVTKILSEAGKKPAFMRFSSDALLNWLTGTQQDRIMGKKICLVNIDTDNTEIAVIFDGKLNFSRVASVGAVDLAAGEKSAEISTGRLISEIDNSIALYTKASPETSRSVSEFIITGAASVVSSFKKSFEAEADKPISVIEPLSTVTLADGALSDKGVSQDSSICDLLGSIFLKEGINLISAEQRKAQKIQEKLKTLMSGAVIAGIIFSLLAGAVLIKLQQKQVYLDRVKKLLRKIEPESERIEEKLLKLEVIKEQSAEGASSLDAIYNLHWLMPSNVSLIDFNYDEASSTVRFRGTAQRMSDVSKLPTTLEKSGRFSNVQIRSAAMRRRQAGEIVDFQIWCIFKPAPKEEKADREDGANT